MAAVDAACAPALKIDAVGLFTGRAHYDAHAVPCNYNILGVFPHVYESILKILNDRRFATERNHLKIIFQRGVSPIQRTEHNFISTNGELMVHISIEPWSMKAQ